MTFPHAAKGVKKIFSAEIISLVGSLLLGVTLVLIVVITAAQNATGETASAVLALTAMLLGLGALVLLVVGAIIGVVGYFQAAKDEREFGRSILCTIFSLVLSVSGSVLLNETGLLGWLSTALNVGSEILKLLAFVFAILGLMILSEKCGKTEMVERGRTILRILIAVNFLTLLSLVINKIFLANVFNSTLAYLFSILALLLSAVQYILFLRYLAKANRMLREN